MNKKNSQGTASVVLHDKDMKFLVLLSLFFVFVVCLYVLLIKWHIAFPIKALQNIILDIEKENETSVLMCTYNSLYRFETSKHKLVKLNAGITNNGFCFLKGINTGDIWVKGEEGISVVKNNDCVLLYSKKEFPGIERCVGIYKDNKNILWLYTLGEGIYLYSEAAGLKKYRKLTKKYIQNMIQDSHDIYWFGTRYSGVYTFDGKVWMNYTIEDSLSGDDPGNNIENIIEGVGGGMWVISSLGIGTLHANHIILRKKIKVHFSFKDSRGGIWISLRPKGLIRYNGEGWEDIFRGLPVRTIFEDSERNIWIGTENKGVRWFNGDRWVCYEMKDMCKGGSIHITMFYELRRDTIWIIGRKRGSKKKNVIMEFDKKTCNFSLLKMF